MAIKTLQIFSLFVVFAVCQIKVYCVESTNQSSSGDSTFKNIQEIISRSKFESAGNISDFIFVVGKTGMGKTPFVMWQCLDNAYLWATRKDKYSPYLMNGTFGEIATQSQTLWPELYMFNESLAYYDFPGFMDSRGPEYEVSTAYLIERLTERAKNVKILLVIDFNSLNLNLDRDKLKKHIELFSNFVVNIDKFKNSMALIVTHVPKTTQSGNEIESDTDALDYINYFLLQARNEFEAQHFDHKYIEALDILCKNVGMYREVYEAKRYSEIDTLRVGKEHIQRMIANLTYASVNSSDFAQVISAEAIAVLEDVIRQMLQGIIYPKIKTFVDELNIYFSRKLVLGGAIADFGGISVDLIPILKMLDNCQNMSSVEDFEREIALMPLLTPVVTTLFQNGLKNVFTYIESLAYLKKIVASSKIHIEQPISLRADIKLMHLYLRQNITNFVREIDNYFMIKIDRVVLPYILERERKITDLDEFLKFIKFTLDRVGDASVDNISKVKRALLSAKSADNDLSRVDGLASFANKFQNFYSLDSATAETPRALENLQNYLVDCEIWYSFLVDLKTWLSAQEIAENWQQLANTGSEFFPNSKNEFVNFLERKTGQNSTGLFWARLRNMNTTSSIDSSKMMAFHAVKGNFLDYELLEEDSGSSNVLRVTGRNVKISDIVKLKRWDSMATSEIEIFALNRVFFDQNVRARGIKLSIIAPIWEASRAISISINGENGAPYPANATSSTILWKTGDKGEAGRPGKPGGYFLGIGEIFIREDMLTIEANGGKGGQGQHGGRGNPITL